MPDFLKNITGKLSSYFKGLKKGQKARLIVFAVLAVVLVAGASVYLNQKPYTVLYSGMEAGDAGEVLSLLSEMGVNAKAQGTDTILVESEQADAVRMELAAEGYPKSGLNFDIFAKASGLGTTDMEKRVYYQFQLQENLSQVIKKMAKIEDAVVSISLPEESAFVLSGSEKPATASVLLKLKQNEKLGSPEVRAIAELVSKSISGLHLEDVRIVDADMKLYGISEEDESEDAESNALLSDMDRQLSLQKSVAERLRTQVVNLLTPVFGEGRVSAEVNVTLDFDKKSSESVVFTPPLDGSADGIAISMKELAEHIKGADAAEAAQGVAGTDPNGGTSAVTTYPGLVEGEVDENSVYSKVSRETNYEVNETRTQIKNAQGNIKDISVAVVIDSSELEDDYTDNVISLVANAIGVETARISVELLPFFKLEPTPAPSPTPVAEKEVSAQPAGLPSYAMLIGAGAGLLILLLLVLLLASRRKRTIPVYAESSAEMMQYAAEDAGMVSAEEELSMEEVPEIPQVEDTTLTQLEKYVDKNPEAVAQLLRNWLSDEK